MKTKKTIFILLPLIFSLCSCGLISPIMSSSNGQQSNGGNETKPVAYTRYLTNSVGNTNDPSLQTCYKYGDYYHYWFYLGYVENVPLQSSTEVTKMYKYNGATTEQCSFTTTTSTSESITKNLGYTKSKSCDWELELGQKFGYDWEMKSESGVAFGELASSSLEVGFKTSLEFSFAQTIGESFSNTSSSSVETAKTWAETYSETHTFTFSPDSSEIGYYRYIMEGTVDLYAFIAKDSKTNEVVSTSTYSVIDHTYWTLDYSPSSKFEDSQTNYISLADERTSFLSTIPTFDLTPDNVKYNVSVWDGKIATTLNGAGTEQAPYEITTAQEFAYVSTLNEQTKGKYFSLSCNIDLNNYEWESMCFYGFWQGNGHAVLHLNNSTDGLFKIVEGNVSNFGITDSTLSGRSIFVGDAKNSVFESCFVDATLNSNSNSKTIGGFVSKAEMSSFKNCFAKCEIVASNPEVVGGFVGEFDAEPSGSLEKCYTVGSISCNSVSFIGGIIGTGWDVLLYDCISFQSISYSSLVDADNPCGSSLKGSSYISGCFYGNDEYFENCYYYDGVNVTNSPSKYNVNGTPVNSDRVFSETFWSDVLGFDSNIWDFEQTTLNSLPKLKAFVNINA